MNKNIKNRIEFKRRIEILWDEDYWERELEEFPSTVLGGFEQCRFHALFQVAKLHPEYHIVTCIGYNILVNRYIPGGQIFYLAEGDSDPHLIHDPYNQFDTLLLYSLNSGLSKVIA